MNGYQRYIAMLKSDPVDFLPRTPILMQYAAEYIGSNYAAFASDYRVLVRANEACAKDFGMDQVSCISDPYRETEGFGSTIEYVANAPPRSTHPLQHSKDLSRLPFPDPLASRRMLDRINAVRAYKQKFDGEYSILGWIEGPSAEAADLRDSANFLIDLLEDEAFCRDLMDVCIDVGTAFASAQIESGADTVGIGDSIASQVSPDVYERLIQPREKRLVRAIQGRGAYAKLHICGDITYLLPGISDLGVDIVDVDHMVDLTAVRRAVGDRVVITGNMDPVGGILRGTPLSIREHVLGAYRKAGNPYMVNAGCEIPSGTPPANLTALCQPLSFRGTR